MILKISLSILLSYIIVLGETARILGVFPTPSISHQVVFRPLTQELAKRGHELVILTTDPAFEKGKSPENLTEIDFHDISYTKWKEILSLVTGNGNDNIDLIRIMVEVVATIFEMQIQTKEVQDLIKSKTKFDLVIVEALARPALVFSHVFNKVPLIQMSSFMSVPPNYQVLGSPTHPILFPESARQKLYNLTIWDKFFAIYNDLRIHKILWDSEPYQNEILRRNFGPDVPTVSELGDNVDMLFLNINPIWEGNRAVPPGVIHLGGLHQKPWKELPNDLKSYLDASKQGVIYMSFGTNVIPSMLPPEKIQVFTRVFSKLPYDVLLKWDKDELPGKPANVKLSKWLPQSDLLRHPKIKLFITQGGLQSTDEAISAGVPVIGFPMLGDQWYNTEKYVHHKIGLQLELQSVTEDILHNSIKTVIDDKSYRHNMVKLGEKMRDQPQTPLERAVWWTEYVLRHGGAKHLRSPAANISWAEYLILDVLLVLLISLLVVISSVVFMVRYILTLTRKIKIKKLKKNL